MNSSCENKKNVFDILHNLKGVKQLKELIWERLEYTRVNQPLSRRGWSDTASKALVEDPILFASGGDNEDFKVIYARLASDKLLLGLERPVVTRLLRENPYALFIFSNLDQDRWHFLNVKDDPDIKKRQLFRRITVGPEERIGNRLRTTTERIEKLDIAKYQNASPLTIQELHDEAFNVESVGDKFFGEYEKVGSSLFQVGRLQPPGHTLPFR